MSHSLVRHFYIDCRALKVFRALLGLVVIYDTIDRFLDFDAHYGNESVLPINILHENFWGKWNWSLLTITDNTFFQVSVFAAVIIAAILLSLGYKTRFVTILCWIGVVSIQNRNPLLYQGGDDLLRMLLFWSIFLPLSNIRNYPNNKELRTSQYSSVISFALLCQVLFPFFFSALFKDSTEWWTEGSAIYYAFNLDQIARPLAIWLAKSYDLSVIITRTVYASELLILPLFLMPFFREHIRIIVFFFLVAMNLGIILTLMIGIFPLCFFAASFLFLPTSIWDITQNAFTNLRSRNKNFVFTQGTHVRLAAGWVHQSVVGFLFALVILWNMASLPSPTIRFPHGFDGVMNTLKLSQSWGMFAPTVLKEDGWIIMKAELNNASVVDLNSPDAVLTYIKPKDVLQRFQNDRWRKYTEQIVLSSNSYLRQYYCEYLVKSWKKTHQTESQEVKRLSIIWMKENTTAYPSPSIVAVEKLIDYKGITAFSSTLPSAIVSVK